MSERLKRPNVELATMSPGQSFGEIGLHRVGLLTAATLICLFILGGVGYLAFVAFMRQVLMPQAFGTFGLPLIVVAAATAATFSPCSLPALPGFVTLMSAGSIPSLKHAVRVCLSAASGAVSVVVLIGLGVAVVGAGVKTVFSPYVRVLDMAIGVFLIAIALLHFLGWTTYLPLVKRITGLGSDIWERAIGKPTGRTAYLFGSGFVAVGVG